MAEMFHLGFEIDTRPLAQTSVEANKAVDAVTKLGTAEQKLSADSQRAADGLKKVTEEAGKAAKATQDAAQAKTSASQSAEKLAEKLQGVTGTLRMNQQDVQALAAAMRGQSGLLGGMEAATGAAARLAGALGPIGIGIGALAAGVGAFYAASKPLADAQDQMALFDARMRNALGSSAAAKETMGALYEATQKTGMGFRETADAFLRLARNGEALGATRSQLMQLTDVVQKLGAVSGASRGEVASGMLQLSQALASGKLNGDELRSIMENMPALAKAIADNLGVGIGQLRQMGASGELTGQKVFNALLNASAKANEEYAKLPDTVEKANKRTADAMDQLLATLGQKWNSSGFVSGVSNFFANIINKTNSALQGASLADQIATLQAQRDRVAELPGVDAQRRLVGIDARLARLRAQAQAEVSEAGRAAEEEDKRIAFAPIKRAVELGGAEYDEYFKKVKKARDESQLLEDTIGNIQIRLKTGVGDPSEANLLPALRRQASIAKAELEAMAAGLEKAKKELGDQRLAQMLGGGGGGTGIVTSAIQQERQAREKGVGGSLQDFIGVGIAGAVARGGDQIAAIRRQVEAQQNLTSAVGQSRSAVLDLEVANEVLAKRFDLFGKLTGPAITDFMLQYQSVLRLSKMAVDDLANAQARLGLRDQIASAQAGLANVGNPYAGRLAANDLQAQIAARRDPVQAQLMRELFGIQEQTGAANTIDAANRNAAFNRSVIGMSPSALRDAELARRIADAQRNVAPDQRGVLGDAMRGEDASMRARDYDSQEQALRRQMKLLEDRQRLVGLIPNEYRVQNALLEKRNQLELAGAPKEVIDRQLQITEQLERQTIAYERQKRQVDGIVNAFVRVGDGMESAFREAIEKGLGEGTKAGLRQFEFSFRTAIRKMGAELTYEIAIRPFMEMIRNMAMVFGQRLLAGLGMGGNSGFTQQSPGGMYKLPGEANGGVYDVGGVRRFAMGGAFTNSVVNSPTLFAFANGGALGMMGEAGPEAIMPLKRDSSGRLGVSGGGGDVQVVINDMRADTKAPAIQVAESRGPDNRRVLQVLVRDEVRRVVRSGELDTEMYSSFGVSRSVARK